MALSRTKTDIAASRDSVELTYHLFCLGFLRAFYLKMEHTVPRFMYLITALYGTGRAKEIPFMKREYSSPKVISVEIEDHSIVCVSSSINKTTATPTPELPAFNSINVYSSLTQRQKLAAMSLMIAFGGSCPETPQNIDKINHIMTVEGGKMGVSGEEVHVNLHTFSGMKEMANTLKGANRKALESLFLAYYCIVAIGKSAQAVQVLLGVYKDLGFSEHECISFLENRVGRKIEDV